MGEPYGAHEARSAKGAETRKSNGGGSLCADPAVDQVWQRKPPLKQRFRVARVWTAGVGLFPGDPTVAGQTVALLEPLNGGREIVSTVPELHERCELVKA